VNLQILDELDSSIADVKHANDRCLKGSSGFDIKFDSSKSTVITDYSDMMCKIKSCMEKFSVQIDKDVTKITAVRDEFVSFDKALSQAILERSRPMTRDSPRRRF